MALAHYNPQFPDRSADPSGHLERPEFMVDPLIDRHDLSYLLRTNWKVILLVPFVLAVLATTWKAMQKPTYESSAMLLVDSSLDQLLQVENVGSGGDSVQESLKSLEVAVVADSVVLRVVERLDLRNANGFLPKDLASQPSLPDAKLLNFIQKNRIKATLQPETRIIKITASDPQPERARLIASTFVEEFQSFLADQRRGEVGQVKTLLQEQVDEAKQAAIDAERGLKTLREESEGLPLDQDHELFSERLTQFGSDLNTAVRARVELEGIHESLSSLDESTPAIDVIEIAGYRNDSHFTSLQTSLANAKSRLSAAREQYTSSHPAYLSAEAEAERFEEEIATFAAKLVETVSAKYEAAQKREALLRYEVDNLQKELVDQKARSAEFRAVTEEVENSWLHYKTLQQRLSENIISTEMPGSIATVVSEPLTPFKAAGPPTIIFAVAGGFAGLFLVAGFLAWKILAGIPFTDARQLENRFRLPVIADWTGNKSQEESANAMMPYLLGGHAQIIQVSAPGLPGESEAVARNLSLTLAAGNRPTLLIQVRGTSETPRIKESNTRHLSLLTLTPEDIFDQSRFSSVLPKLRASFERIIIEPGHYQNPPLIEWISSFADREVMAIAKGETPKAEVARRIRRLDKENGSRIGFIFVDPERRASGMIGNRERAGNRLEGAGNSFLPGFALKH